MKVSSLIQTQTPTVGVGVQNPVDDGRARSNPRENFNSELELDEADNVASEIAHDLNNLLTPILLYAEVLQKAASEGSEIKPNLAAQLVKAVEQAQILVGHLTQNQLLSEQKSVDIHRVIESAMSSVDPRKEEREFEMSFDRDLWQVAGNETMLFRVFLNLLVNALQATPSDGHVWIEASNCILKFGPEAKQHSVVQIDISDNGSGISQELQERVFLRHVTTGNSKDHSGIGLTVVSKIVNHLGGSVCVESEEGKGSTFSVFLPAAVQRV